MTYKKSADVTGPHESLHQVQIIVSKKKKTSDRTNHCIGYKSSCPAQTDTQTKSCKQGMQWFSIPRLLPSQNALISLMNLFKNQWGDLHPQVTNKK